MVHRSTQRARWALDDSELETLKDRAEYFGIDKTKDFEDYKEKYLGISQEDIEGADSGGVIDDAQKMNDENSLENNGKSDILKMNLQLFAEKDIAKQSSDSLKRAIKKYQSHISEHEEKIAHPEKYISDWSDKDVREQNGLIKHWQKEIRNFNQSIDDRIDELKNRGDYNG